MAGISQIVTKGISLADDAARYAKACGKRSILECKFVQNKIDKKSLYFAKDTIGDTFSLTNRTTFASRIKELSTPGKESETLKKLFSTEFKPLRHVDENGYMVTTVISKKSQKPVEIFVKEIGDNEFEFYKKVKNTYEIIGRRKFSINKEMGTLEPGYMANYCQDEFIGIGIRGHQLAVEKTIKEGLKTIRLDSLPKAELFHEKCLFKPLARMRTNNVEIEAYVSALSKDLAIPLEKARKLVVCENVGKDLFINLEETTINLNKIIVKIDPKSVITHPTMGKCVLTGKELALWQDMARSQPITI